MRKIININQDWKFVKEDAAEAIDLSYNDTEWNNVTLPHTWNAVDGANGYAYHRGACWYRKWITVSSEEEGKRIFIEFQGSNSVTELYLNGNFIGQHQGGYSTFRFDLTDHIYFGKTNLLAVRVDNSEIEHVYPLRADFTFYGGIYRDVSLISAHPVHVDIMDYGSQGVYVIQEDVTEHKAGLTLRTRLTNSTSEEQKVRLWIDILDSKRHVVGYRAAEVSLQAKETRPIDLELIITEPKLWNGLKGANMYEARVSLQRHNDTIDQVNIPFGLRYFHVEPQSGFYLNGKQYPLHGVSRHQDRKDSGWAITQQDQQEDMSLIKDMGATSIRLAHYQHQQYFYDLCDLEGMVVWAEIPFITQMFETDTLGENAKSQMIELIRQNYNHPSIMFWGIQNEIQIDNKRQKEALQIVRELNVLTKTEEPTRLTTMANLFLVEPDDEYNEITDVIGYNKYDGWYSGKAEDLAPWLDGFHANKPNVSLSIAEYGAEGIIEYHSDEPKVSDYTEEYHALYHEKVWSIFSERPYLWATYVWNMFDFGANIRDEGGVQGRNNKGLVSFDRKVKKDAFYMYKAHWSDIPFVHLTSKRYVERASELIDVKVYTNCEEVQLFVNGERIQTKSGSDKILIFKDIALGSGNNHIQAKAKLAGDIYEDQAWFTKVDERNLSYVAPVEDAGNSVANWFDKPVFDEEEQLEEVEIPDGVYSSSETLQDLVENEETRKIVVQVLGDVTLIPMYGMMKGMKVDVLASMDRDGQLFTSRAILRLNRELIKIQK
ncbi:glycoside hydrolase family 2 protein [Paenibacillus paridis]|uniref:glycoside hydrolase family 2 protein n=1 Tax=Paenibacillus paridis TaxID=2583376 RepID=UPI00111FA712|nr:glycoside hydrolase family 2 TIM barrel-domain containing protein [Paenibacillus paridis]